MMSRRAAAIVIACISVFLVCPIAHAEDQAVTWTNPVNVTVTGTVLQKTGGWDGVDDAGATSLQELTAGDGYIEFTVGEATTFWLAGLSHGNDGTGYADIDFAFRFNGAGWADVLENGVYQSGGDTPYAAGDVFRDPAVDRPVVTPRTRCVATGRCPGSPAGRLARRISSSNPDS